jgi:ribose-phosphate pyrophosphokinase
MVCSTHEADAVFVPLALAADAARQQGARRVGLVAPYLGYLRQDAVFHVGESLSCVTFARLLSQSFDWLVTVDPHLHRLRSLEQIYRIPARAVSATTAIAGWIRAHVADAVLIGPDEESRQWVAAVAEKAGAGFGVLGKTRRGDREVELALPDLPLRRDQTPVLVDDIISSGATMKAVVRILRDLGMRAPVCIGVHALLSPATAEELRGAGAGQVVTSNTIEHATNHIDVAEGLAAAARELIGEPRLVRVNPPVGTSVLQR